MKYVQLKLSTNTWLCGVIVKSDQDILGSNQIFFSLNSFCSV